MNKIVDYFNNVTYDNMHDSARLDTPEFREKMMHAITDPCVLKYHVPEAKPVKDGEYRVTSWCNGDDPKIYELNREHHLDLLKQNNWLDSNDELVKIEYRLNPQGFRCDYFDDSPALVAFGCSFTYGVGHHKEDTWPDILSKRLGLSCVNLGIPGASIDLQTFYAARWMKDDLVNPKAFAVLVPPPGRLELIEDGGVSGFHQRNSINWTKRLCSFKEEFEGEVLLREAIHLTSLLNIARSVELLKLLATSLDIPCVIIPVNEVHWARVALVGKVHDEDLARDCSHPGRVWQKAASNVFYNQFEKLGFTDFKE